MEQPDIKEIINNVFICMPFINLNERYAHYFRLIKRNRLNLEIGIDFRALDKFPAEYFRKLADELLGLGISTTVHAPFHEIFLGAPDTLVRKAALKRMDNAFKVIKYFLPKLVVVHLNYEEKRYRFIYDEWLNQIIPNLKRYAEKCGRIGAFLSVENVYEETSDAMTDVFNNLKGYPVYHCLDVGHLNCFSKMDLESWLFNLGPYIRQFHLHDNNGINDTHSPIGTGNIDFNKIKAFISKANPKPVITLEPHSEEDLWKTLEGFHEKGLLESLKN
ncbi:MAG: sugar phosphate isomerase/epimerase [Spirochaetota bacterium]